MNKLLLLYITCLLFLISRAEEFNIYKDYSNAKKKPRNYAKQSVKHAIEEYLGPGELRMQASKKAPLSGANSFNDAGSFFTIPIKQTKTANLRGSSSSVKSNKNTPGKKVKQF